MSLQPEKIITIDSGALEVNKRQISKEVNISQNGTYIITPEKPNQQTLSGVKINVDVPDNKRSNACTVIFETDDEELQGQVIEANEETIPIDITENTTTNVNIRDILKGMGNNTFVKKLSIRTNVKNPETVGDVYRLGFPFNAEYESEYDVGNFYFQSISEATVIGTSLCGVVDNFKLVIDDLMNMLRDFEPGALTPIVFGKKYTEPKIFNKASFGLLYLNQNVGAGWPAATIVIDELVEDGFDSLFLFLGMACAYLECIACNLGYDILDSEANKQIEITSTGAGSTNYPFEFKLTLEKYKISEDEMFLEELDPKIIDMSNGSYNYLPTDTRPLKYKQRYDIKVLYEDGEEQVIGHYYEIERMEDTWIIY